MFARSAQSFHVRLPVCNWRAPRSPDRPARSFHLPGGTGPLGAVLSRPLDGPFPSSAVLPRSPFSQRPNGANSFDAPRATRARSQSEDVATWSPTIPRWSIICLVSIISVFSFPIERSHAERSDQSWSCERSNKAAGHNSLKSRKKPLCGSGRCGWWLLGSPVASWLCMWVAAQTRHARRSAAFVRRKQVKAGNLRIRSRINQPAQLSIYFFSRESR